MKAFPGTPTFDQDANRTVWQEGMDLRDYFAAAAMKAFIVDGGQIYTDIPNMSYKIADAMMEARNGSQ